MATAWLGLARIGAPLRSVSVCKRERQEGGLGGRCSWPGQGAKTDGPDQGHTRCMVVCGCVSVPAGRCFVKISDFLVGFPSSGCRIGSSF